MSLYEPTQPLFPSFFLAGFESANHQKQGGERVDSVTSTGHDRFVRQDYALLAEAGLLAARDNVRWTAFEPRPHEYQPEEVLRVLRASRERGIVVIWDLLHYGWPDDLDFWSPDFVDRAAAYARRVATLLRDDGETRPFFAPVNEMNYQTWAGGDQGMINPFAKEQGGEMKEQLTRCAIAMSRELRDVLPLCRLVWTEPIVNIVADRPEDAEAAEAQRQAAFEAWDIVSGRQKPELGGQDRFLDIVGVNYYPNNQLVIMGDNIGPDDPRYRRFSSLLQEVWERYHRPMFVAETAAGGEERPHWLAAMTDECLEAIRAGVPIEGLTLYPIFDYPNWTDGKRLEMGLWGYPDEGGNRPVYEPLLNELRRCQKLMGGLQTGSRASLR